MIKALEDHHRKVREGIAEIRRHCDRSTPDTAGLAAARLRLSRASAARTQYVREVLLPILRRGADSTLRAELDDMQHLFAAKRLASSEHVTMWSSKAIAENWNGYRVAAQRIWGMMEEQMKRERMVFTERAIQTALQAEKAIAPHEDRE